MFLLLAADPVSPPPPACYTEENAPELTVIGPGPGENVPNNVSIWLRVQNQDPFTHGVQLRDPLTGLLVLTTSSTVTVFDDPEAGSIAVVRMTPDAPLFPHAYAIELPGGGGHTFFAGLAADVVAPEGPLGTKATDGPLVAGCHATAGIGVEVTPPLGVEPGVMWLALLEGRPAGLARDTTFIFVPAPDLGGTPVNGTVVAMDLAGNVSLAAPGFTAKPGRSLQIDDRMAHEPLGGCTTTALGGESVALVLLALLVKRRRVTSARPR